MAARSRGLWEYRSPSFHHSSPPPSHLPSPSHTVPSPGLGWGGPRQKWGGAKLGKQWARAGTNDLHTAALPRRPAAGGPRPWDSVLQGSQWAEVSDAPPSQPLPHHTHGDDTVAALPSQALWVLAWGRSSECLPCWGSPFSSPGLLVGCPPSLGDAACNWPGMGGGRCFKQKAGKGWEEAARSLAMRVLVGTHEGSGPGEAVRRLVSSSLSLAEVGSRASW